VGQTLQLENNSLTWKCCLADEAGVSGVAREYVHFRMGVVNVDLQTIGNSKGGWTLCTFMRFVTSHPPRPRLGFPSIMSVGIPLVYLAQMAIQTETSLEEERIKYVIDVKI